MQRTPVVQAIKALRRAQPCGERRFCGNTFGHGKAQCGQITAPQPYWARQCPTVFVGGYDSSATAAGCLGSGMTWRCIPSVMLRSTSQSLTRSKTQKLSVRVREGVDVNAPRLFPLHYPKCRVWVYRPDPGLHLGNRPLRFLVPSHGMHLAPPGPVTWAVTACTNACACRTACWASR